MGEPEIHNEAAADPCGSYWADTVGETKPFPVFTGDAVCDVAIVGAGFTGLSAGYHLSRQGYDCVILEAKRPGWGASGRNAGIVVPRFKLTFPELAAKFGVDGALALHDVAHDAVDTLEAVINDCRLDCGFSRSGHLTPYTAGSNALRFESDASWLEKHAGDTAPRILPAAEASKKLGTDHYAGAYLEPRGGGIHPLQYCTGLANALLAEHVSIYSDSTVQNWRREGHHLIVATRKGQLRCRKLVLALNGHSDTTPAGTHLRRRIIPVMSSVIVTERLPESLADKILASCIPVTDAKRLTNYYRRFSDGRFLFGGRGGSGSYVSEAAYRRLLRDASKIYPELGRIRPEYRWSGRVAVTLDGLPRIGMLQPDVYYAMGYNGRGVALANYMGRMLSNAVSGEKHLLGPLGRLPFHEIPFHFLRLPAKKAMMLWYQFLDVMRP